ncbi:uncharacterized protein LOC141704117 [Apium graveolens]|uniref:uncharacterized protein LOC141704117 n=1 Tax=Apium graveolens TaxID=4045 RepID=UPI003D7B6FAC
MARQLSMTFLGKVIEGIWHTGIVVYGTEYYFSGGVQQAAVGTTQYGTPVRVVDIGNMGNMGNLLLLTKMILFFPLRIFHHTLLSPLSISTWKCTRCQSKTQLGFGLKLQLSFTGNVHGIPVSTLEILMLGRAMSTLSSSFFRKFVLLDYSC